MAFQLPAEIETEDQLFTLLSNGDFSFYFAYNEDGPWIVFCGADGEWHALRPVNEDERELLAQRNGVLDPVDALVLPLTLVGGY